MIDIKKFFVNEKLLIHENNLFEIIQISVEVRIEQLREIFWIPITFLLLGIVLIINLPINLLDIIGFIGIMGLTTAYLIMFLLNSYRILSKKNNQNIKDQDHVTVKSLVLAHPCKHYIDNDVVKINEEKIDMSNQPSIRIRGLNGYDSRVILAHASLSVSQNKLQYKNLDIIFSPLLEYDGKRILPLSIIIVLKPNG